MIDIKANKTKRLVERIQIPPSMAVDQIVRLHRRAEC